MSRTSSKNQSLPYSKAGASKLKLNNKDFGDLLHKIKSLPSGHINALGGLFFYFTRSNLFLIYNPIKRAPSGALFVGEINVASARAL